MYYHFISLILVFFVGGLIGYPLFGWWGLLIAGLIVSLFFLTYHLIYLDKLYDWLQNPKLDTLPNGKGIWVEIFDTLLKQTKNRKKSKQKLANALRRSNQISEAMPNGIILLDKWGRIEWFNQSASLHLHLDRQQDNQAILKNLIRLPEFHQFLNDRQTTTQQTHIHYQNKQLLITKTPLENEKTLLVSQDMTLFEQFNQTRADFVANVSHELRTPLTVISGFTETLLDNDDLPSEQRQAFLGLMQQENERMLNLIEDLLTLSKLEHSSDNDNKQVFNLSQLVKKIVQDTEKLSQNQHEIVVDIDDELQIFGVALDIYNALSNLTFNAVRYTPSQGIITIALKKHGTNTAKFSVSDTGIGISAEHLPRLTERFYRVDKGRHRQSGGTGLGLAISKHALAKHGSVLQIDSEMGKGSCFWAEFSLIESCESA